MVTYLGIRFGCTARRGLYVAQTERSHRGAAVFSRCTKVTRSEEEGACFLSKHTQQKHQHNSPKVNYKANYRALSSQSKELDYIFFALLSPRNREEKESS